MKNQKMGFLGRFIAENINLADPTANTKWRTLTYKVMKYEPDLRSKYPENSIIKELINICRDEDLPDKLMVFGRKLEEILNSADMEILKDDNLLLRIIELYSETTISSNDKRAIDLSTNIMKKIMEIKNG